MAKYLKIFNPETQEWEVLSPYTTVNGDSGISSVEDTQVVITNSNYNKGGETKLTDTLDHINDDITKLKRNVSWLAEHGGGGTSGGGSGLGVSFGFYLESPSLVENSYISTTNKIAISFRITGGTSEQVCQYRYKVDGVYNSSYKAVKCETTTNFEVVLGESEGVHQIVLEGIDPYNLTIKSFSFFVTENSLSVAISSNNTITNNEIILTQGSSEGVIRFDVKNTLLNASTVVTCTLANNSKILTYNFTKSKNTIAINAWDLIESSAPNNSRFSGTIRVESYIGANLQNTSEVVQFTVRIQSINAFNIFFNGITYYEPGNPDEVENTKIVSNGRVFFETIVNIPATFTKGNIFYALQLRGNEIDEALLNTDINDSSRTIVSTNERFTIQFPVGNYPIGNNYILTMKVWSADKTASITKDAIFDIVEADKRILPRQYPSRYDGTSSDTCFAVWDRNCTTNTQGQWVSTTQYTTMGGSSPSEITTNMNLEHINGENVGFITTSERPYVRLQNEAFATINLDSTFREEVVGMMNLSGSYSHGFNISISFKADTTPNRKSTVFLWGTNDTNGELSNGFKITVETVEWSIFYSNATTKKLKAYIPQNTLNTVDFSLFSRGDGQNKQYFAAIYINGILNAISNVDGFTLLPDTVYFGCSGNDSDRRFSDINLYEFAVYTKALSPLQIVVNSKNAHLGDMSSTDTIDEYVSWKNKNLISSGDDPIAKSVLISDDSGDFAYGEDIYTKVKDISTIPIVWIDARQDSNFTENFFHTSQSASPQVTANTYNCIVNYYDPEREKDVTFNGQVSLQGTSTLGYRIKNLEVYVNELTADNKRKLFQPKDDWFPENSFTLKADVVDSSHANNATIGKWINDLAYVSSEILTPNPAIRILNNDTYKPKDKVGNVSFTHTDTRDNSTSIDFHEKLQVKHNLEGFQILLFITFSGEQSPKLIGIYSFNLGRQSYFNMGMKFLKSFSRRENEGTNDTIPPAIISHYEEYEADEVIGDIKVSDIYSYEFNANGSDNTVEHPTWSQDDKTIIKHIGDFRYPLIVPENVYDNLSSLFTVFARAGGDFLEKCGLGLKSRYRYSESDDEYTPFGSAYTPPGADDNIYISISERLNIPNARAYFVIAHLFGMVDSLGKNLTLRTWDGGETWWTCFYDMDTALGISNEGEENISVMACVDKWENVSENGRTVLKQNYLVDSSAFNAYKSKLWAVLRSENYELSYRDTEKKFYEVIWNILRSENGVMADSDKFVDTMSSQISSCGELLYNFDYYSKYVVDTQNLSMLHGLRIEYVRQWLKSRTYFLDGFFDIKDIKKTTNVEVVVQERTFGDSPMNNNTFSITNRGTTSNQPIQYIFSSNDPVFIKINTGASDTKKFILNPYEETVITTDMLSTQAQTVFTSSNLLTTFKGLRTIKPVSVNSNVITSYPILTSLSEFDLSNCTGLSNNPIDCQRLFVFGKGTDGEISSSLEKINLSHSKIDASTTNTFTYNVDLSGFKKVREIDITGSDVTSLILPDSILSSLKVSYSRISSLRLVNQPLITSVDLKGCAYLQTLEINNCQGITSLSLVNDGSEGASSYPELSEVNVQNCNNITSIVLSTLGKLDSINIGNNSELREIRISQCYDTDLKINLFNLPNLETLVIDGTNTAVAFNLPARSDLCNITHLQLTRNNYFSGIKYLGEDSASDCQIDLTPFTALLQGNYDINGNVTLLLNNNPTLKSIKCPNSEVNYLHINGSTLTGNTSLERIYGSYSIDADAIFRYFKNFHLGKAETTNIREFETGDTATNIKIKSQSLSFLFYDTAVNYYDMVYTFYQCNSGVTNISYMFNSCPQIESPNPYVEAIPDDLFTQCSNVTSMDFLFGNTNIYGILKNTTIANLKSLTSFNGVFMPSDSDKSIMCAGSTTAFFPKGNQIEVITHFNPRVSGGANFRDSHLLANLTKLKEISYSFDNLVIEMYFRNNKPLLFEHCPNLETISHSFNNCTLYKNTPDTERKIDDFFGLNSPIKTIVNSFSHIRGVGFYDTDVEEEFTVYIGNGFFRNIKNTIETLTLNVEGRDFLDGIKKMVYLDDCKEFTYDDESGNTISTCYLADIPNGITPTPVKEYDFPTHVFDGCDSLETLYGFFAELHHPDEDTLTEATAIDVLGNGVMSSATALKSFRRGFANMHFLHTLSPDGFKDNSLTNLEGIFMDGYGKRVGQIPYHLFYQSSGKYIENLDNCFAHSISPYVKPYSVDDETFEKYIILNIDGTEIEDATTLNDKIALINAQPEVYKVNEYLDDGTEEFRDKVNGLGLDDTVNNPYKDNNTTTINISDTVLTGTFGVAVPEAVKHNYFCPPDLFAYCKNTSGTTVNNAFSSAGKLSISDNTYTLKGAYGRVPEVLFQPISEVITLMGVFSDFTSIFPDKFGYEKQETNGGQTINTTEPGSMFPEHLLDECNKLQNVTELFHKTVVRPKTVFKMVFPNSIKNMSGLFSYSEWGQGFTQTSYQQMQSSLIGLNQLNNISSMLEAATGITINQNWFTQPTNSVIEDVSRFAFNVHLGGGENSSTVPLFQYWPTIRRYSDCYPKLTDTAFNNCVSNSDEISPQYRATH